VSRLLWARWLFWNNEEKRLRAFWRLALHTALWFVLSIVLTVPLIFLISLFDFLFGGDLAKVILGGSPMQILENPWVGTAILSMATGISVLLSTFILGKWVDRRKLREFGFKFSHKWWVDFAFGLGLGAFLMGAIFLFGLLTGTVQVRGYFETYSSGVSFFSGFAQSLVFYILVGVYEEVLSRGYHLINLAEGLNSKFIGKKAALISAFVISSLIFGLLHLDNPSATWISTLTISLAGIFLGLGMLLTGNLAIPIGLHITWNFFQGSVFGFPVSGMNHVATLIASETVGPQWLAGGPFGPEAGVMGVAAMVIGSMLTMLWIRRRGGLSLQTQLVLYTSSGDDQDDKSF